MNSEGAGPVNIRSTRYRNTFCRKTFEVMLIGFFHPESTNSIGGWRTPNTTEHAATAKPILPVRLLPVSLPHVCRQSIRVIVISTPAVPVEDTQEAYDEAERTFDAEVERGVTICLPHSSSIDQLVDRRARCIRQADRYCKMIRDRGMIPGLSTHMPEPPLYAAEQGLDIATCIQIYNAAGFMMQIEVEWVQRMIQESKYPIMTIKPMAAGRLTPLVGLAFAWATLGDKDMVTVGTMMPDEARECIDISRSVLERQATSVQLQTSRSKASVMPK